MSKFNSETSFLYQLFMDNSDFIVKKPCKVIIVKKPCKVIYFSAFMVSLFLYLFIHTYIHLQINILRPSRCLKSIPRQVLSINFSKTIQIPQFSCHARFFICLFFLLISLIMFIQAFTHLYINIDKFSVSTFQGEFKFYSFKAMQVYLFVYLYIIFIIIYVFRYVYTYRSSF